jgi:tetratricopeptide (TPR) repeat protein
VKAHLQLANDAFESDSLGVPPRQARDRSIAHLETALKLDPASAEAYGRMASAEALVDDTDAMRRHARKALELNPNEVPARYWSGVLALEAGDMDQASSHVERLANADPLSAFTIARYAGVLRMAQRPKAALAAIERARVLANDPDPRSGGYERALILADLGRRDEAQALARQVGDAGLLAALGTPEALAALDRRTDLDAHQRAWVDLAPGRAAAHARAGLAQGQSAHGPLAPGRRLNRTITITGHRPPG